MRWGSTLIMAAVAGTSLSSPLSSTPVRLTPAGVFDDQDELELMTAPPVPLLSDGWVKLDTDSCGSLTGVGGGRKTLNVQHSSDDIFNDDDLDDPELQERLMVSQWLSGHVEVAAISDGVEKWCGDGWFEGEDMPSDTIA
jgi:hypothetical protein